MKKKIALLLAALMIFGAAIPMHVFAANTDNIVTRVYTNGEEGNITIENPAMQDTPRVLFDGEPSYLRVIANKNIVLTKDKVGAFNLNLTNGQWFYTNDSKDLYESGDYWNAARNVEALPSYDPDLGTYLDKAIVIKDLTGEVGAAGETIVLDYSKLIATDFTDIADLLVLNASVGRYDKANKLAAALERIEGGLAAGVEATLDETIVDNTDDTNDLALVALLATVEDADDFIEAANDALVVINNAAHLALTAAEKSTLTRAFNAWLTEYEAVEAMDTDAADVDSEKTYTTFVRNYGNNATVLRAYFPGKVVDVADLANPLLVNIGPEYGGAGATYPNFSDYYVVLPSTDLTAAYVILTGDMDKYTDGDTDLEMQVPLLVYCTSDTDPVTVSMTLQDLKGSEFSMTKNMPIVDVPGVAQLKFASVKSSRDTFDLDTLSITEKKVGDFGQNGGWIYLIAPDGFAWALPGKDTKTSETLLEIYADERGGYTDYSEDTKANYENYYRIIGSDAAAKAPFSAPVSSKYYVYYENTETFSPAYDKNQILAVDVSFTRINEANKSATHAMKLYIDGLRLTALDSAPFKEDLTVKVTDESNASIHTTKFARDNVVVKSRNTLGLSGAIRNADDDATFVELKALSRVDWGIDFYRYEKKEVVEIWAGKKEQETNRVVFEERTPVSWWAENPTDFVLVDAEGKDISDKVKIESVQMNSRSNLKNIGSSDSVFVHTTNGYLRATSKMFTIANAEPVTNSQINKGKVSFTVTISAAASYAGPVYLHAKGRGIPASENTHIVDVQIAEVKAPVALETKTTYVEVGYQTVPVADLTVKEAAPGLFEKGENIVLALQVFDSLGYATDISFIDATKVTVTNNNGAGLLGKATLSGTTIVIPVDRASTSTAMDFTVKGLKVYLNRAVPEGHYDVVVGGSAFVDNYYGGYVYDEEGRGTAVALNDTLAIFRGLFTVFGVVSPNYVEVKTQGINKALSKNVVVTTDTPNVAVVDGVSTELQAPVYIDVVTSRTMVPINFVAQALGIEAKNVIWDATERKVIVVTAERTVEFFIDTNKFTINGAAKYMVENGVQVKSIINVANDRSYIPFTYLAQAFGITVAWDAAKHLAIYNPTLDQKTNGAAVIESIPTFTTSFGTVEAPVETPAE